MIEATSCGGVVIFRGKILLLYKNYKNKYEGWVLPKGTVEDGEEFRDTATREVLEETGAAASIIKYIGKSQYTFTVPEDTVEKEVHWYLMMADSYYSKPQREEYFVDSGSRHGLPSGNPAPENTSISDSVPPKNAPSLPLLPQ